MSFLTRIEEAIKREPRSTVCIDRRDLEELIYHFKRIDGEMRISRMMEQLDIRALKELLYEIDEFKCIILDKNGMYDRFNSKKLERLHYIICEILNIWDKINKQDS
jgi:hypothetical protein